MAKTGMFHESPRLVPILLLNSILVITSQISESSGSPLLNPRLAVAAQATKPPWPPIPRATQSVRRETTRLPKSRDESTPRYRATRAVVVDDRLSALRREPNLKSIVIRRLSLGRKVWIIAARASMRDQPPFYRVAVTRRTSGWIHASAVSVPGRIEEDYRLYALIEAAENGFERIRLCVLFAESFSRSKLLPKVLLAQGQEADRVARSLRVREVSLPSGLDAGRAHAFRRDLLLSDPRLDRYSRLGVNFELNSKADHYVYDGKAYRQILSRYPTSEAAQTAQERLLR